MVVARPASGWLWNQPYIVMVGVLQIPSERSIIGTYKYDIPHLHSVLNLKDTLYHALEELAKSIGKSANGRVASIMEANGIERHEAFILRGIVTKQSVPAGPAFEAMFNIEGAKSIAQGLIEKGFIMESPEPPRLYVATEKGIKVHEEVLAAREKYREAVCSEFTDEELKEFIAYIEKLRMSVEKY